jgi:hypothetical protein
MNIEEQIKELLTVSGCEFGFAKVNDGPEGLPYAISIAVPLSDAVIDEIDGAPTYSYFHHYRTVNAYIDRILLQTGLLLQSRGYRYMPIAASQSIPMMGSGRIGAILPQEGGGACGLGSIGKNALFLHRFTARACGWEHCYRLSADGRGTQTGNSLHGLQPVCLSLPRRSNQGAQWHAGIERSEMFDANACNNYMRDTLHGYRQRFGLRDLRKGLPAL